MEDKNASEFFFMFLSLVFLVVCFLLITLLFFIPDDGDSEVFDESYDSDEVSVVDSEDEDVINDVVGGDSEGGEDSSISKNDSVSRRVLEEVPDDVGLPDDFEDMPCGYYYFSYGVCVGSCPAGSCLEDDGSCYCRA